MDHPISRLLYRLGAGAYFTGVRIAAPFHRKARLMTEGRQGILPAVRQARQKGERYIWMHVSSLGEFEQGRPLIEAIKAAHPEYKICLTFFSPSGYEIRKDYPLADLVTYLPFDTSRDLRQFVDLLSPELVIFVKYEFWLNALFLLREKGIPTYLISAKFRPGQPFFKPWGGLFRSALRTFAHIFVQDSDSLLLLQKIGIDRVTVAGDTRADRVLRISETPRDLPIVRAFRHEAEASGRLVLVAGSSWERDEAHYLPLLKKHTDQVRAIIAPHEVGEERITSLLRSLSPLRTHRYSRGMPPVGTEVLVVDTIGLLSSVYAHGDLAYIGGGFGAGIHNILEPAAYGLPVLFGPRYGKFAEARALVAQGGAFSYETDEELARLLQKLARDDAFRSEASRITLDYLRQSAGATSVILSGIPL